MVIWMAEPEVPEVWLGIVVLLPVLVIAWIIFPISNVDGVSSTEIYSISDSSFIHGSFVLGTGYIGDRPVYIFYKSSGSGYSMDWVGVKYAVIIEDEQTPCIVTRYHTVTHLGGFAVRFVDGYELHVPVGTIKERFVLDSEL